MRAGTSGHLCTELRTGNAEQNPTDSARTIGCMEPQAKTVSLSRAATELRDAKHRLDGVLVGQGLAREPIRAQVGELGADTVICAAILSEAFAERQADWMKMEESPGSTIAMLNFGGPTEADPAGRLVVIMKSFYFFLRAYQDAMYAVLFEVVCRSRVGDARMQKAVEKADNPVGKVLRERSPEYLPWFQEFREQRNKIKSGVNFGTLGPAEDLGISFNMVDEAGGLTINFMGTVVRVADIVRGLEMSARLTDMTVGLVVDVLNAGKPGEEPTA